MKLFSRYVIIGISIYNTDGFELCPRRRKMNKWDKRFMDMADTVAGWSSCFKPDRKVGDVIVKDKRILTTGYNGASSGILSCGEKGECLRVK